MMMLSTAEKKLSDAISKIVEIGASVMFERVMTPPAQEAPVQKAATLDFGVALANLRAGRRVFRQGWNGKGMWLALQTPDAHSKMRRPYIYIKTVNGEFVPWVASHGDLLGTDWVVD